MTAHFHHGNNLFPLLFLFCRNLLDKDTFSKSDPCEYVVSSLLWLKYCCSSSSPSRLPSVWCAGYVALWVSRLFVHCSEAKTLTLISQLECACMHFSHWVILFLLLVLHYFISFCLFSGTLFTVCVLYTQGVETKQWREVSPIRCSCVCMFLCVCVWGCSWDVAVFFISLYLALTLH